MGFNKSYTDKEIELKVPARITTHFSGEATTIYYFRSDEVIRTAYEKGELQVITRGKLKT